MAKAFSRHTYVDGTYCVEQEDIPDAWSIHIVTDPEVSPAPSSVARMPAMTDMLPRLPGMLGCYLPIVNTSVVAGADWDLTADVTAYDDNPCKPEIDIELTVPSTTDSDLVVCIAVGDYAGTWDFQTCDYEGTPVPEGSGGMIFENCRLAGDTAAGDWNITPYTGGSGGRGQLGHMVSTDPDNVVALLAYADPEADWYAGGGGITYPYLEVLASTLGQQDTDSWQRFGTEGSKGVYLQTPTDVFYHRHFVDDSDPPEMSNRCLFLSRTFIYNELGQLDFISQETPLVAVQAAPDDYTVFVAYECNYEGSS